MGFKAENLNEYEPNSTLKISLSKLPPKPRDQPIQVLAPPLRQSISIPFRWEVAPGKARPADATVACTPPSKSLAARRLDLPPRLWNDDSKIAIMPSPITVLDGPYVGRSLSLACTLSFRKGGVMAREEGAWLKKRGGARNLGSGRWGSFKGEGKFSLSDAFKSEEKIKRFKRRSFFNLSCMHSNIYGLISVQALSMRFCGGVDDKNKK